MFKICTKKYDHIFFSPHLDDVTLSCGGLITKLHKAKILVVTIFSGIDEGKTSNFGKQFIFLSGFNNARDFIESRKSEEKRVARFLGYDFLFLNYPDAIFRYKKNIFLRQFLYPKDCCCKLSLYDIPLIGKLNEHTRELLKKYLRKNGKIYFPLGIGRHVDHQITNQLGTQINNAELYFYEDFPYCINQKWEKSSRYYFIPKKIYLSKPIIFKKYQAINYYKSQIHPVFNTKNNLRVIFFDYYQNCYENYWYLKK